MFLSGFVRLIFARYGLLFPNFENLVMLRPVLIILLLGPCLAVAEPWFDGNPDFADEASRSLAAEVLAAHGGMQPMTAASSLQFSFFTKKLGNPTPFYSSEALDLATGDAYVEWPFWDATIGWNGQAVWTENWPMPMPAGFFVRLTSSFLTLPWQMHADDANIGPVRQDTLPNDNAVYDVIRITFDHRGPGIPGNFYDLFIDPETRLMKAIRFDISHPGMVANPSQPLGPNYHVFGDYRDFNGMLIPTFYQSYGQGSANGGQSNAYHFVWNLRTDQPYADSRRILPDHAQQDSASTNWWSSEPTQAYQSNGEQQ
jgi:hypothetical protein